MGRIKRVEITLQDTGNENEKPSSDDYIDKTIEYLYQWWKWLSCLIMQIGSDTNLRLNHLSVVSLQSKVIYMIPCGHRKNLENFEPGTDGPSLPYSLFPYQTTDLTHFGQVFWKSFTVWFEYQNLFDV